LELAWILNSVTPIAELERMTQYKDKAQRQAQNINAALFNYPVLMAADILIYHATLVPVGVDQKQHLELTNVLARKFNRRFGEYFAEVEPLWTKFPKVMDLKRPAQKMSKSVPEGCIFLDDEPEVIRHKLQKAVTASEAGKKSPGEENLMELLGHFGKPEDVREFKKQQADGTLKYSELKEVLAQNIAEYFKELREKKQALLAKPNQLKDILADGAVRARKIAGKTLQEVKNKIGLL
jgi:tryptophanyl-tRNA synthetase